MNVLAFCFLPIASVKVGVTELITYLEEKGDLNYRYLDTLQITDDDIEWADLVICIRGSEPQDFTIAEKAKNLGKNCLYYLDDDLFNIPSYAAAYPYYQDYGVRNRMETIMRLCECLWTNNSRIAKRYENYFKHTIMTEVPVSIDPVRVTSDQLKIGFAGGSDHTHFINELLKEPIQQILEKNSYAMFEFIGARLDIDHPRVSFHPHLNFNAYKELIKNRGWSIGLAPLQDSEFHSCKYYNKFLEYGSLGIAGIYSQVYPYKAIVKNKLTGILIPNKRDMWFKSINQLIRNSHQRGRIMRNSLRIIEDHFNYKIIGQDFKIQLSEVFGDVKK